MRVCAECGRSDAQVTMHRDGDNFVCNHCIVGGPLTLNQYGELMNQLAQHCFAIKYGAVIAVDQFLYVQDERRQGNECGMTQDQMDQWADRVNAYLFTTRLGG